MANQELLAYIREHIDIGISAEAIRGELLAAGWPESEIENALRDAAAHIGAGTTVLTVAEDVRLLKKNVDELHARLARVEGALGTPEADTETDAPRITLRALLVWGGISIVSLVAAFAVKYAFLHNVVGWATRTGVSFGASALAVLIGFRLVLSGRSSIGGVLAGLGLGAGLGIGLTSWKVYGLGDAQVFGGICILIAVCAWVLVYRARSRFSAGRALAIGFLWFWTLAGVAWSYLDRVLAMVR